jgi:hypothetical protein
MAEYDVPLSQTNLASRVEEREEEGDAGRECRFGDSHEQAQDHQALPVSGRLHCERKSSVLRKRGRGKNVHKAKTLQQRTRKATRR